MKSARELYPGGWDPYAYTYTPIINSFGEVLLRVDLGEYQGDTLVLYRSFDGTKYGFLSFSWGSCPVCDALADCETYEEVDELIAMLHSQIVWHDSREEMIEWLRNRDWEMQPYYWLDGEKVNEFVVKAVTLLSKEANHAQTDT